MDKPKRKYESLLGRVSNKPISFCTSTPLEECVTLLQTRSQQPRIRLYGGFPKEIRITVKPIDSDNYSFELNQGWGLTTLKGTLRRMGEETLVHGTAKTLMTDTVTLVVLGLFVLYWGLTSQSLWGTIPPLVLYLIYFQSQVLARNELCERLVQIVGKSIKYQ
jgi:hypothetical protein